MVVMVSLPLVSVVTRGAVVMAELPPAPPAPPEAVPVGLPVSVPDPDAEAVLEVPDPPVPVAVDDPEPVSVAVDPPAPPVASGELSLANIYNRAAPDSECLTRAIALSILDGRASVASTADGIGAVTDTPLEVVVLAQASSVIGGAAQRGGQGDHVVDAGLLVKCQ